MMSASELPLPWAYASNVDVLVAVEHRRRRQLLSAELRAYGHPVREAYTGLEVYRYLRRCRSRRPDEELPLVFADLAVPLPGGLHLLAMLRFVGLMAPFILIIGEEDRGLVPTVQRFGGVAIEERAVDLEDLSFAMASARHRAREALAPDQGVELPERREHQRLPVEIWIRKRDPSSATFHRSANLSLGGLSLRQGLPEEAGTRFALSFVLPGEGSPVEVKSRIANVRPTGREFIVGMQFLDLPSTARRCIAQLVDGQHALA